MNESTVKIRLLKAEDFEAVVAIDAKITKVNRPEYYEQKFNKLFKSIDNMDVSLVAEDADGSLVGFIMGELYMGEYGIFKDEASMDTIGVDPYYQHMGIGEMLMSEFVDHLKKLGVKKINCFANWNDTKLVNFFQANKFFPSKMINLTREI